MKTLASSSLILRGLFPTQDACGTNLRFNSILKPIDFRAASARNCYEQTSRTVNPIGPTTSGNALPAKIQRRLTALLLQMI